MTPSHGPRVSPDRRADLLRADHPCTRLAAEGLVELRQVGERSDHPIMAGGVRVDGEPQAERLVALLPAPRLRQPEEEALLRGEAVDRRRPAATLHRALEGCPGDLDAAEIAD